VPKAQKNPDYYRRAGFTITDKASGAQVDPSSVDWAAYGKDKDFPYRLVQRPGDDNALGNIKFMFPNPYGVYLHDTSSPLLFRKEERIFSSGCIRVERPSELASSILSVAEPIAPEAVKRMISEAPINRHLNLKQKVPLHVVYMTAWADEHAAYFYEDSYARESGLLSVIAD
jgi:murein L,D-transpeptidase YcbB/YkuD